MNSFDAGGVARMPAKLNFTNDDGAGALALSPQVLGVVTLFLLSLLIKCCEPLQK
jgi:hypothetical protein